MAQLLSNLPIGAKVKFGKYAVSGGTALPITWIVVAKNHASAPAYPTNSVTLMTETSIDALALDAGEPYSPEGEVKYSGNTEYWRANLDQWLNKDASAGEWFVASHGYDQAPTNEYVGYSRGYYDRPGFLNSFSTDEKSIILNTIIRCTHPTYASHSDIERKVFIPSGTEVGEPQSPGEGNVYEYFKTNSRLCGITDQLFNDPTLQNKPGSANSHYLWWTRTAHTVSMTRCINTDENWAAVSANSMRGVRPALNIPSTTKISDTIDSNGSYTVVFNSSPLPPSELYVPSSIYGGRSNTISWSKAIDPDGDAIAYRLECSIDGGEYISVYEGAAVTYAHLVPFGMSTVSYRVRATDPSGESSAYTTSATINVVNNNAPVISGSDTNLGVKSDDFTGTYTITDANSDIVTVTEAIDGVQIRSLVATLGEEITYGVTETTWLALPNGSHTLTISATDGIDTTVRTIVFTKLVDSFSIRNSTPWVSSTMPSRIMVVVTRNIPSTATFKVEVCNNGYDTSPTWEDATDAVMSGLVHVFNNKTKTATDWGVLVRVTVGRNGATGACYVSAIGGNFE